MERVGLLEEVHLKFKRFIVCADVHGDMQDKKAVAAFLKFNEMWGAKIRVMGGDLFDFRAMRKNASKDEQEESMGKDLDAGEKFLEDFRPTHFLRGNHDERLWALAKYGKGPLGDHANAGVREIEEILDSLKCKMYPYDKRSGIVRIGHLKILHGYYTGDGAAKQHAIAYGSCLFGHTHTIDEKPIPGIDRRVARNIGCLCDLDMEYCRHQPGTLRWAHGWAYGVVNERTGDYRVFQAERVGGSFYLPTNFVEIK